MTYQKNYNFTLRIAVKGKDIEHAKKKIKRYANRQGIEMWIKEIVEEGD